MKEWHSDRVMELLKENLILKESLQKRETFIRRTFGRYLTDEVLEELLNDSNGLRIGGERREVEDNTTVEELLFIEHVSFLQRHYKP